MIVYRIEHPSTNKGPYCGEIIIPGKGRVYLDEIAKLNTRRAPSPDEDLLLVQNFCKKQKAIKHVSSNISGSYIFGFADIDDVRKWFGGVAINVLINEAGFRLVSKRMPKNNVVLGTKQCMFKISDWAKARTHPITF